MNIVCIGSGNVATHLAIGLKAMGADITQVWSRDQRNAELLAALTQARTVRNLTEVDQFADCYLIAVKDDAIADVAQHLMDVRGIVIHTSGATGIEVLKGAGSGYGVMYPLQTFSRTKALDLKTVPFCVEADTPETLERITALAQLLSTEVSPVTSNQRQILHLAAVFACNFSNHLYLLGSNILAEHQLNFNLLKPLIMETASKIQFADPKEVQTGPAVRNDEVTINRHLNLLEGYADLQKIYSLLTESIRKTYL